MPCAFIICPYQHRCQWGCIVPNLTKPFTGEPKPMSDAMKRYRCHKIVTAARIIRIHGKLGDDGMFQLTLERDPGRVTCDFVDNAWVAQHKPVAGGYFIKYEDGYTSYSPAKAFEEGYTLIEPETAEVFVRGDAPTAAVEALITRFASTEIAKTAIETLCDAGFRILPTLNKIQAVLDSEPDTGGMAMAVDGKGKPFTDNSEAVFPPYKEPGPVITDPMTRIATAMESIAVSLVKITNPPHVIRTYPPGTDIGSASAINRDSLNK